MPHPPGVRCRLTCHVTPAVYDRHMTETTRRTHQSERVRRALEAGYTAVADGIAAVQAWQTRRRPAEGMSAIVDVIAGQHHVQVYVSPTARSVRVFIDGAEMRP